MQGFHNQIYLSKKSLTKLRNQRNKVKLNSFLCTTIDKY